MKINFSLIKKILSRKKLAKTEKVFVSFVESLTEDKRDKISSRNSSDIDRKIVAIQRSTKTTFRAFGKLHNHLRSVSKAYYNWHLHPYHEHVHWGALGMTITTAILIVTVTLSSVFVSPEKTYAATYTHTWDAKADFETNISNTNLDTTTTAGSVKVAANPSPAMTYNSDIPNLSFGSIPSVALDSSGNMYITDTNNRIVKLDSSGNFIWWLGYDGSTIGTHTSGASVSGNGNGQFNYPIGVSVDGSGNIYVADYNNNRIQKFDSSGNFVWWLGKNSAEPGTNIHTTGTGSSGSGNGQFNSPFGVSVDGSGNIYVADSSNSRIQKFDFAGNFVWWLGYDGTSIGTHTTGTGSSGSGDGHFKTPHGVFVDGSGNIYVTDPGNMCIQKFDSAGNFVLSFGSSGSGNGQFFNLQGIFVDGSGNIYVTDNNAQRIQRFDSAGNFVWWLGYNSAESGTNIHTTGAASSGNGNGQFNYPQGVSVDGSGNIYVADSNNKRIQKFDSVGVFLFSRGAVGPNNSQFSYPYSVATDSGGNIYAADTGNNRIQKFDSSGNFVWWLGKNLAEPGTNIHTTGTATSGSGNGQFNGLQGVFADGSGNIYVADSDNSRIQKFDSSSNFVWWLGKNSAEPGTNIHTTGTAAWGTGNGQLNSPSNVVVDGSGNIYVADTGNRRIQKFDSSGNFVWWLGYNSAEPGTNIHTTGTGSSGAGNGQFNSPRGIFVDGSGNIYVADTTNMRIQKFDSAGNFIWWLGKNSAEPGTNIHTTGTGLSGTGNGQFSKPSCVSVDGSGNIYVADTFNMRIQKFDSSGNFLGKYDSTGAQNVYGVGLSPDATKVYFTDASLHVLNNPLVYYSSGTLTGTGLQVDASDTATWSSMAWAGTFTGGTQAKYRFQTSDNGSDWSAWSDYYTDTSAPYSSSLSLADSRYINIELTLTGGNATPQLDSMTLTYLQNGAPVVASLTASQSTSADSYGKINLSYSIFDGDNATAAVYYLYNADITLDGDLAADATTIPSNVTTNTPASGTMMIDDEMMTYTGTTAGSFTGVTRTAHSTRAATHADITPIYILCPTTTGSGAGKSTGSDGHPFTGTWNIKSDLPEAVISGLTMKVAAHDGEQIHQIGSAISAPFNIDTKVPVLGTVSGTSGISVNTGAAWTDDNDVNLALSASDDSDFEMEVRNDTSFTGTTDGYDTVKDWTLDSSAANGNKTVYARFIDIYGNYTDASDAIEYNTTPVVQTVTASQATDGSKIINIGYQVKDADAAHNATNQNQVSANLQYSTDSGSTWHDCTTTTGTGLVTAGTASFAANTAAWDAGTDLADSYFNNTVKIKVAVNDNEGTHSTAEAISSTFSLDTGNPALGTMGSDTGIKVNDGLGWSNNPSVNLTLSATDDTTKEMQVRNDTNFTDDGYEDYSATKNGWSVDVPGTDGSKTIYVRFKDAFGNTSDAHTTILLDTTAPETPLNLKVYDTSERSLERYSLTLVWDSVPAVDDFQNYTIERKIDGGEYSTVTTTQNTVYTDMDLDKTKNYTYRVKALDIHNNYSAVSEASSYQPAETDVTAPNLTGPDPSASAEDTTATITWYTDEGSDSFIEYGTDTSYGFMQGQVDHATKHTVTIVGLIPSTTYHFRTVSSDVAGNKASGMDFTFTTTKPKEASTSINITGATVQKPGTNPEEVTIVWTTDKDSTSQVLYGLSEDNLDQKTSADTDLSKKHFQDISGLKSNTKYYYQIKSIDEYGNVVLGEVKYFVTAISGSATPAIGDVEVSDITMDSAIVSWTTTVVSSSVVDYGIDTNYGSKIDDLSLGSTTQHVVRLKNLTQGIKYHYRVSGVDPATNSVVIANVDASFSTLTLPSISNISVKDIGSDTATITWSTNTETDSYVDFGSTSLTMGGTNNQLDNSQGRGESVKDHAVSLVSLKPATSYSYKIKVRDSYGNSATSAIGTFDTIIDVTPPKINNLKSETSIITDANGETKAQAIVSWSTDEPGTTLVKYNLGVITSGSYTFSTTEDTNLTTSHVVIIPNLSVSSTYHLVAISKDASNNIGTSGDYTILTLNQDKTLLQYVVQILEQRFFWLKGVFN